MTVPKVYTIDEVAEIVKMTRKTLYTFLKNGSLKAVKIGKNYRVTEENLQDFLTHGTEKTKKDNVQG